MTIDIKYENYSVKDFLEDDLFLQWQLAPTETLDEFWKQVLQQYPDLAFSNDQSRFTFPSGRR